MAAMGLRSAAVGGELLHERAFPPQPGSAWLRGGLAGLLAAA
jgi:hypothetical protein